MVSKKFMPDFRLWCQALEERGYTNYWKVLNAKDFGIPQNRERVFLLSTRDGDSYEFPESFELKLRLKDILEQNVDERYYLSQKAIEGFTKHNENHEKKGTGFTWKPKTDEDIANCLRANGALYPTDNTIIQYGNSRVQQLVESGKISGDKIEFLDAYNQQVSEVCGTIKTTFDSSCMSFIAEPKVKSIGNTHPSGRGMNGVVYDSNYLSPTLTTNKGEGPKIMEPSTCATRGRNPDNPSDRTAEIPTEQRIEIGGHIANCLTTVQKDSMVVEPKIFQIPRGFNNGAVLDNSPTITSNSWECNNFIVEPKIKQVGNLIDNSSYTNPQRGRVYDVSGISPNIDTLQGGGREPKIIVEQTTYEELDNFKDIDVSPVNADPKGLCRTLKAQYFKTSKANFERTGSMGATGATDGYRIRKLTPRETFRLMGVSNEDIDKIQTAGISRTQQYKMAGNSIVVDVLFHIFRKLFVDRSINKEPKQLKLF